MQNIPYLFSLIAILCALSSCSSRSASPALAGSVNQPENSTISEPGSGSDEYIQVGSIHINGKIPLISSPKRVFNLLGQPDSIVSVDLDDACGFYFNLDSHVKLAFVKGARFEVRGDSAVLTSVVFKDRPQMFLLSAVSYQLSGVSFERSGVSG